MFQKAKWIHIALITLLLCLAGLSWKGFQHALKFDNSVGVWFLEDDPLVQQYRSFQQLFGNDETLFVLIQAEKVLSDDFLLQVKKLQDSLASLAIVKNVSGPANIDIPSGTLFGLAKFRKLWSADYSEQERKDFLDSQQALGQLFFNADYSAIALYIQPLQTPSFHLLRGAFIEEVTTISNAYFQESQIHYGGVGIIYNALNVLSQDAFGFYVSLTLIVIFVLLFIFYRSTRFLLLVLLSLLSAIYFSIAIYGLLGYQLNIMTSLTPIIIIVLGVMDLVHIINKQQASPHRTTLKVLKTIVKPCLITTLTTMVGFLVLSTSPMFILRQFGLFSALGILMAFLFSFFFAYLFLKRIKADLGFNIKLESLWNSISLTKLPTTYSWMLLAVLLIIGFIGANKVKIDSDTLAYLPKSHSVVKDHGIILESWGAYLPIELLVKGRNSSTSPLAAQQIINLNELSAAIQSSNIGIDKSFGIHSFYTIAAHSLNGGEVNKTLSSKYYYNQINTSVQRQYPDLFQQYYHQDSLVGRVTLFTKANSASEMAEELKGLNSLISERVGDDVSISVAGYLPMYAGIIDYVIETQLFGIISAIVFIFLLLYLLLKQFRLALIGTVINLLPVLAVFAILGFAGINLDTATASIAAIVLGICVDDTIHYMYAYKQNYLGGAVVNADAQMKIVSRSILNSSIFLLLGFGVMLAASLKTVQYFGILISAAVFVALIAHFYVLPLFVSFGQKTKNHNS